MRFRSNRVKKAPQRYPEIIQGGVRYGILNGKISPTRDASWPVTLAFELIRSTPRFRRSCNAPRSECAKVNWTT